MKDECKCAVLAGIYQINCGLLLTESMCVGCGHWVTVERWGDVLQLYTLWSGYRVVAMSLCHVGCFNTP